MPRLSLGLGVQTIRKAGGGAAPSGIPVASTTNLFITLNETVYENNFVNRAYAKFPYPTAYYFSLLGGPELIFNESENPNIWSLGQSDGEGGRFVSATNTSTNGDYIPTTGWTGPGLITLTITAA